MSHTPGPWTVIEMRHLTVVADQDRNRLATVLKTYVPNSEDAEANARLIAAAPDLLAACQATEDAMQAWDDHVALTERAFGEGWATDPTGSSHLASAHKRASDASNRADDLRKAAIAKACKPAPDSAS